MKKQLFLTIVFLFGISVLSAQDRTVSFEQLPENARTFVNNHFNASDISMIREDPGRMSKEYKVYFKDGGKVKFNGDGEWQKVKVIKGGVPKECVPTEVTAYVWEAYPQNLIMEIERHGRGYEIELSNGLELKFNRRGEFVKVD